MVAAMVGRRSERERERVRALGREDGNRITGVRVQSGM